MPKKANVKKEKRYKASSFKQKGETCPEGYHKVEIKPKREGIIDSQDPARKKKKTKFRCVKDRPPSGIREKEDNPRRPDRP